MYIDALLKLNNTSAEIQNFKNLIFAEASHNLVILSVNSAQKKIFLLRGKIFL
jgi:hypothetical protein